MKVVPVDVAELSNVVLKSAFDPRVSQYETQILKLKYIKWCFPFVSNCNKIVVSINWLPQKRS